MAEISIAGVLQTAPYCVVVARGQGYLTNGPVCAIMRESTRREAGRLL